MAAHPWVGRLVVSPAAPHLGLGRWLGPADSGEQAISPGLVRIWLYASGRFHVDPPDRWILAPGGPWPPSPPR